MDTRMMKKYFLQKDDKNDINKYIRSTSLDLEGRQHNVMATTVVHPSS